jgi:ABC-type phosphate/phosphonate transport system substrate-binding protein
MYDWPEIRPATDAFWAGLARHLGVVGKLDRGSAHHALWRQPQLFFSQTCGYPLTHEFKGILRYLATPHYLADGCEGPYYRSIIMARDKQPLDQFAKARPAINSMDSMSGMLALKLVAAPLHNKGEFFAPALFTGSHLASMVAVQQGVADICAIDCVCVALARRHRPEVLAGLSEIARSQAVPGLPYVTRANAVPTLRRQLLATFADPDLAEARAALLLSGITVLPDDAYDIIPQLEAGL